MYNIFLICTVLHSIEVYRSFGLKTIVMTSTTLTGSHPLSIHDLSPSIIVLIRRSEEKNAAAFLA